MNRKPGNPFQYRIRRMNEVFNLPCNDHVIDHGKERVKDFHMVLQDEVTEILDCNPALVDPEAPDDSPTDLVAYADVLADIIVYCRSEAVRWGIPIDEVLDAVMDSQDSKLDKYGKPIMSEDGSKFIKGPNYKPPEEKIAAILSNHEASIKS